MKKDGKSGAKQYERRRSTFAVGVSISKLQRDSGKRLTYTKRRNAVLGEGLVWTKTLRGKKKHVHEARLEEMYAEVGRGRAVSMQKKKETPTCQHRNGEWVPGDTARGPRTRRETTREVGLQQDEAERQSGLGGGEEDKVRECGTKGLHGKDGCGLARIRGGKRMPCREGQYRALGPWHQRKSES